MIRILSWNVNNVTANISLALFSRDQYDIITIQEPGRSGRPPCPIRCQYHLIYSNSQVATYLHKGHFPIGSWTAQTSADLILIHLLQQDIRVAQAYHQPADANPGAALRSLYALKPDPSIILLGDFNLHHPSWDYYGRTSNNTKLLIKVAARH